MNRNKAKLKFNPNNFEIIEEGDHVVCEGTIYSHRRNKVGNDIHRENESECSTL